MLNTSCAYRSMDLLSVHNASDGDAAKGSMDFKVVMFSGCISLG